jgi:hypothetical protein
MHMQSSSSSELLNLGNLQAASIPPMNQPSPLMGMQQPMGAPMGAMGMNPSPYMGTMNQSGPRGPAMNIGMMQTQQQNGNRTFDPFGNLGQNLGGRGPGQTRR